MRELEAPTAIGPGLFGTPPPPLIPPPLALCHAVLLQTPLHIKHAPSHTCCLRNLGATPPSKIMQKAHGKEEEATPLGAFAEGGVVSAWVPCPCGPPPQCLRTHTVTVTHTHTQHTHTHTRRPCGPPPQHASYTQLMSAALALKSAHLLLIMQPAYAMHRLHRENEKTPPLGVCRC